VYLYSIPVQIANGGIYLLDFAERLLYISYPAVRERSFKLNLIFQPFA
jgi:hypothetical protein